MVLILSSQPRLKTQLDPYSIQFDIELNLSFQKLTQSQA